MKRELILESPDLLLLNKIRIFNFNSHMTSYGHLRVWSKIDKIDLSGIATLFDYSKRFFPHTAIRA